MLSIKCLNHLFLSTHRNRGIPPRFLRLKVARTFANASRHPLEIDESGEVKLQLPPKVEALKDKLIYCDYIERKRLKYGYNVNKKIEATFEYRKKCEKLRDDMDSGDLSVALKYLREEPVEGEGGPEIQEVGEERPRPIHMPYAATDDFREKEMEEEEMPEKLLLRRLNPEYQQLYEKYLEAKNDTEMAPRLKRKMGDLGKLVEGMEAKRPEDRVIVRPIDAVDNVPKNWMTDYEQFNDAKELDTWESNYGTADVSIPVSSVPCGGCGALLHCQNAAIPGYLPSELFKGLNCEDLKNTICQRCHFMQLYNVTLEVKVAAEDYPEILKKINFKKKRAAIILVIDLTDFPCSIWPDLPSVIGKYTPIFVVGNKVDLLPRDGPRFLMNVKESLMGELERAGIRKFNVKHVELISAQTGFGVERLINNLHKIWEYKGDVYMIGCTNVGKSTLFNALLQSDYCKVHAVDLIRRATTSPWPGTTLNLLKFPILNPVRWRLALRAIRRKAEQLEEQSEIKIRNNQATILRDISLTTLQERIGRTFDVHTTTHGKTRTDYEMRKQSGRQFGIDENAHGFKNSRWCYDTPGVIHPDQVLHLLTTEELLLTLPQKIISPRTFLFKPGQTLFLAGLGRLDLLNGPEFIRITVFASSSLPITICRTEQADELYYELLEAGVLAVPINDPERLKIWPNFQWKEFSAVGIGEDKSVCDILLSSSGWISITPDQDEKVTLRAWTPEGRGIHQRIPALLSKSITLRGARIKSSAAYRLGRQVYTSK